MGPWVGRMGAAVDRAVGAEPAWIEAVMRLEGAFAPSTLRHYISAFATFERWCKAHGRQSLPATPQTVADHVSDMFPSRSVRTVAQRIHMIRRVHALVGARDPTHNETVRLAYLRGRRAHGRPPRQAFGMNAGLRDRLVGACGEDLLGLRDRALLRVGYDTLCRCSELVALRAEDLTVQPDGTGRILVRREKMEAGRAAEAAFVSRGTLAHVEAWLAASGIRSGRLLRPVCGRRVMDRELQRESVHIRLRTLGARAGLAPEIVCRLSPHSMRVGAAQDLALAGRTLLEIMRAGRWRDVSVAADYIRNVPVNVWAEDR